MGYAILTILDNSETDVYLLPRQRFINQICRL